MSRGIFTIFLFSVIYMYADDIKNNLETRYISIQGNQDSTICNTSLSCLTPTSLIASTTCTPKWLCNAIYMQDTSFMDKLKRHFFDHDIYKERMQTAQTYYNMLQVLEHEGTYFTYTYSMPPFGIYGNNLASELKFQVSFKVPIWRGAFWSKGSLFFGYTQTMWFQQFNYRYSNPVRDTNYKPSVFYSYPTDWDFLGGKIKELRIGYLHFSNGIGGEECVRINGQTQSLANCRSRSLGNRIIFEGIWEMGGFGVHISVWPYIPYRRDNPDIAEYVGYANMRLYYKHNRHFAEIHIAPIIGDYTRYHGSIQLGYAYSISKFFAIYGQYFYGYGNSLYEYNIPSQRIGIGLRAGGF